jgi:hypothetical protein
MSLAIKKSVRDIWQFVHCYYSHLPLDFDHVIENQVSEHHQRVVPHQHRLITQPGVNDNYR